MRNGRYSTSTWFLVSLWMVVLMLLLVSCGGAPAPTPTTAPILPVHTDTSLATSTPAVATIASTATLPPPTPAPPATATALPPATPTPITGAVATLPPQSLEPSQDWFVRNLMVGPGRTYVFLASTATQDGFSNAYQLLFSDDDGKTWSPFPGGLPPVPRLYNVNLDYASVDSLFAGASEGGLYHWTGSEWELISQQRVGTLEVIYLKPQIMWSTNPWPSESVVSRSEDGGRTWVAADAGIIHRWAPSHLGQDPRDSNTLYAVGMWLYRGTADGQWKLITPTEGLPPCCYNGMAIEGGNGALYLSLSPHYNQIWRSSNANTPDVNDIEWELVHDFGQDQAVQLLATGPSSGPGGMALYANLAEIRQLEGGGTAIGDYLPYRSPDGGTTWERIVIPGWIE